MATPATTAELLLQRIADASDRIVDLLQQERGNPPSASSQAATSTRARRKPTSGTPPRGRVEVDGR